MIGFVLLVIGFFVSIMIAISLLGKDDGRASYDHEKENPPSDWAKRRTWGEK